MYEEKLSPPFFTPTEREDQYAKNKPLLIKSTTNVNLLNCALTSKNWYFPAIIQLWEEIILIDTVQAKKVLHAMDTYPTFSRYVKTLDTIISVRNYVPVQEDILTALVLRMPNLNTLNICGHPGLSREFFENLLVRLPRLNTVDACDCEQICFLKLKNFKCAGSLPIITGSNTLTKGKQVLVHSKEGDGLKFVHQDISKENLNFIKSKKKLYWHSEVEKFFDFYQINDEEYKFEQILQKLESIEELHVNLNFHFNFSHRVGLCFQENYLNYIIKNLKILDLSSNCSQFMTDSLLDIIANTKDIKLTHLRLSSFSLFTDKGLLTLSNSNFSKICKEFKLQNNSLSKHFRRGIKFPSFTEYGFKILMKSFLKLEYLRLDFVDGLDIKKQISSKIFENSINLSNLKELSLSGPKIVDDELLSILREIKDSKLRILRLEGWSINWSSHLFIEILPLIAKHLVELRIVNKFRNFQEREEDNKEKILKMLIKYQERYI
ncbi:hypothetical protein HK099_004872 [Clydaea vesicula]|uniref:Uncharacterized protein n=1 Tax=Clydaea vesicula TaxID=447962 RepID=A0AAD5XVB2_9FUNG|nr:hypothetical protein HK099_004872 [Clydaea vesicula]